MTKYPNTPITISLCLAWWLMAIIPVSREAEVGELQRPAQTKKQGNLFEK
jgi:hypothetical protein